MRKFSILCLAFIATSSLWSQNNVITYTASSKLTENKYSFGSGFHINAFNVSMSSHSFSEGTGTITFKGEVNHIGANAFNYCSGMTSITIPSTVVSIGNSAFFYCMALQNLTLPDNIQIIGGSAFVRCGNLKSVNIPTSTTIIKDSAFYDCSALLKIEFPSGLQYINRYAFYGCSHIDTLILPNSIKRVGAYSFRNCRGLKYIKLPDTMTAIEYGVFAYCDSIESISLPSTLDSIKDEAFSNCKSLKSIILPEKLSHIGYESFKNCDSLKSVYWNAKKCNKCWFGKQVEFFEFGNNVQVIPSGLFSNMDKLKSIVIPSSVEIIKDIRFYGCCALESVMVESKNKYYDSRDNCNAIIETATNKLIAGIKTTIIPNSVTSIGDYAFTKCCDLEEIDIPNFVTSIGIDAFEECENLKTITIPSLVTKLGDGAFAYCTSLSMITSNAITPPVCGKYCFSNVDKSIPLYVPAESIDAYKAADGWKDFTNIQTLPTGIDQLTDSPSDRFTKIINDGQLIILRDGKMYNALGGEL